MSLVLAMPRLVSLGDSQEEMLYQPLRRGLLWGQTFGHHKLINNNYVYIDEIIFQNNESRA